jgi:NAD(P)H dehydrogenase (quinone)
MKKVFLLLGHPNPDSFNAALLNAYAEGLRNTGAELRISKLSDMQFDPSLHLGYGKIQALEPDLVKFQSDVQWCDHFVIVSPLWWGGPPAALKGLIDRAFLPGFGFKYKEGSPFQEKLLQGRSAHVLLTMDSPGFWYRWVLGSPWSKALRKQILGFMGFKPIRITTFGPLRGSKTEARSAMLQKARQLGAAGK